MNRRQKIFIGIIGLVLLLIITTIIYYIIVKPETKVPPIVQTTQTADN